MCACNWFLINGVWSIYGSTHLRMIMFVCYVQYTWPHVTMELCAVHCIWSLDKVNDRTLSSDCGHCDGMHVPCWLWKWVMASYQEKQTQKRNMHIKIALYTNTMHFFRYGGNNHFKRSYIPTPLSIYTSALLEL